MTKWMCDQTLDDFEVGDKVSWSYSYANGWHSRTLMGTVAGFTKHMVRVEFDKGQTYGRKTLPPTAVSIIREEGE